MPRQRDPDEEDALVTCPRCLGAGRVYRIDKNDDAECPLCQGSGQTTPPVARRYHRGSGPDPTPDTT